MPVVLDVARTPATTRSPAVWIFGLWSFIASALLFWVELMVAKILLPAFGGSASVWTTSLVFFQVSLLAGYVIAHGLATLPIRLHKWTQIALVGLPLATLPVALPGFLAERSGTSTSLVLLALVVMVGAPFFALATASPTLQTWFARSSHPKANDPYFLYALSNLGSVAGLLGYPLVIEPTTSLGAQGMIWTVGYGIFAVLTVAGATAVGNSVEADAGARAVVPYADGLRWAALAFIPSLLLMGVTQHLSTDVASFPLLWTVPLAIYLASFAITFRDSGRAWASIGSVATRVLVFPAVLFVLMRPQLLWLDFVVPLLLLAAVAVVAHSLIYKSRPAASQLTGFYISVSAGGAAGGLFAALVAPTIFESVLEYPLGVALAAILAGRPLRRITPAPLIRGMLIVGPFIGAALADDTSIRVILFIAAFVAALLWARAQMLAALTAAVILIPTAVADGNVLAQERTFFGVYRVVESSDRRTLISGTTSHGAQLFDDEGRGLLNPVSYYHPKGPIGDVFDVLDRGSESLDVGVIGLGVGGLAGYGSIGDRFTFYEIDPEVEAIARDERYFSLLADTPADVDVKIGDGRLLLESMRPQHDLLVVDAFTSDAIPVHLLTVEAIETYLRSVRPGGAVLIHISNRHLDLEPVVGRIARELRLDARVRHYAPVTTVNNAASSSWVLLEASANLQLGGDWRLATEGETLWTDDFSNVVSIMKWSDTVANG